MHSLMPSEPTASAAIVLPPSSTREVDLDHRRTDVASHAIEHLIVVGHPDPGSFNHSLADAYAAAVRANGQIASVHDLYALRFDPLLKSSERPEASDFAMAPDVAIERSIIERSTAVVLVYPIWFGMPPAMIVGYVDRVLGSGLTATAIRSNDRHDLLAGKHLALLTTSGATRPWLAQQGQWHGMRQAFDDYLRTIFSFDDSSHEHFDSIVSPLAPTYAAQCLDRARQRARLSCSRLLADRHRREKREKLSLYGRQPASRA